MHKAQPASRMDCEAGTEKHPLDAVVGNVTNFQHHWPRNTHSSKAAPQEEDALDTLLMAHLKIP